MTLSNIITKIRNKLVEHSTRFFTDAIITDTINDILGEIAEDTGCNITIAKVKMPIDTDGINIPSDLIDMDAFFVNDQKYKRISFNDVALYKGDDYRFSPDFVYYIRNNKLITLTGLKLNDELTLYYKKYFDPLVNSTDELPAEFNNHNFINLITYGVCASLKEMDEDYQTATYYRNTYAYKKNMIEKSVKRRERGTLRWKTLKYDMNNLKVLYSGDRINNETNIY